MTRRAPQPSEIGKHLDGSTGRGTLVGAGANDRPQRVRRPATARTALTVALVVLAVAGLAACSASRPNARADTTEPSAPAPVPKVSTLAEAPLRYVDLEMREGHTLMCDFLRTLLNDPNYQPKCSGPQDCRLDLIDSVRYPMFRSIPWESLPATIDSRELRALSDYRAGDTWPDWYFRTQVKPSAELAIRAGSLRLLKASFDVNNDGSIETMLRYDNPVCNPHCTVWNTVVDPETYEPRLDIWRTGTEPTPIRFHDRTIWLGWYSSVVGDLGVPKPEGRVSVYLQVWDLGASMSPPATSFQIRPLCTFAAMEKQP